MTKDEIAKLKAEHGDELVSVDSPKGKMVFKKPDRATWTDFVENITKDRGNKEVAMRRLALACVVWPSEVEAEEILDKYPSLPSNVTSALSDLAGTGSAFEVKKL